MSLSRDLQTISGSRQPAIQPGQPQTSTVTETETMEDTSHATIKRDVDLSSAENRSSYLKESGGHDLKLVGLQTSANAPEEASLAFRPPTLPRQSSSERGTWRSLSFRYFCAYLFLYNLSTWFSLIPFLGARYEKVCNAFVPWLGKHILHLARDIPTAETGSGDTTAAYIYSLFLAVLALVIAFLWSVIARRRAHPQISTWLRVSIRYVLAITLISYGMFKIIQSQFPFPSLSRLGGTYGDSSPMGLLWTFMGYSKAYNLFTGMVEAGGGALLFFRRTTTLGALVVAAGMLNVVLLNFCYDVPVKLYSLHLLFMALYLAAADGRRLLDILVLNRTAPPADISPPAFRRRWLGFARLAIKILLIGYVIFTTVKESATQQRKIAEMASNTPLYGIWDVDEFARNGEVLAPLTSDSSRVKRMIFSHPKFTRIQFMDDRTKYWPTDYDPTNHTVSVAAGEDPKKKDVLTYSRTDRDHLTINGHLGDDLVAIKLHRFDESKFLLLSRGFHWISEYPFNR